MSIHHLLPIVAAIMLVTGCASMRDSRLEPYRQKLAATYQNTALSMEIRLTAFNSLLDTFESGTAESTIDQFVGSVAITKSRIVIAEDGLHEHDVFSYHLTAPDGSDRWITLQGDKVP